MRPPRPSSASPCASSTSWRPLSRGSARSAASPRTTIAVAATAPPANATHASAATRTSLGLIVRCPLVGAEQRGADEAAVRRRRRDDHRHLVGELVGERLLHEQRVLRDERAFARHLLRLHFADALEAVAFGV